MPTRRSILQLGAGLAAFPPSIARALSIAPKTTTGTIQDVRHVVILMQENRGFDHYFGTMNGVRGFADRFPIPHPDHSTVWTQQGKTGPIGPFHLDTNISFDLMRVEGTPHTWPDAQGAWDQGRIRAWPTYKTPHSMGYYKQADIPFQSALADAFTLCDAYHCSIQTGTNTNRIMLWTGTNDGLARAGGPAIGNSHDRFASQKGAPDSYLWTVYVERLQAAGIGWRIYQDMADNFTDNPTAGFAAFRDSFDGKPGSNPELAARGLSTFKLDRLRADVLNGELPPVSYIVAPAADSEHPVPSSPAQGADFTARVLDALTADPKLWSQTVLLLMYDENDGFFDHVPPPAPPSPDPAAPDRYLGGSTVTTAGEYHLHPAPGEAEHDPTALRGRPYGLGPRVPMTIVSPWSRGGFVNSQVFDHTSVIRFLEARFGVMEPNISPWRRTVCGDLTSAFDFTAARGGGDTLPPTSAPAARAAALGKRTTPVTPDTIDPPAQAAGPRPSSALPYRLEVDAVIHKEAIRLQFRNQGQAGAVFHVYDRRHLDDIPRRYTVGAGKSLQGDWPVEDGYDLWVIGPNGFHRQVSGFAATMIKVAASADRAGTTLTLRIHNPGSSPLRLAATSAYGAPPRQDDIASGGHLDQSWPVKENHGWYDITLISPDAPGFVRRYAGRVETGRPSITDPMMHGAARMTW